MEIPYSKNRPSVFYARDHGAVYLPDGSPWYGGYDSSYKQTFGGSISGVYLPDWRSRIENGLAAVTDMDADDLALVQFEPVRGRLYDKQTGAFQVFDHGQPFIWSLPQMVDPELSSTAENEARIAAYRKLESNFKGLVFLGELREAIRMVRNPALALRRGVDNFINHSRTIRGKTLLSSTRKRRVRDYRAAVSDSWLEYSFGWRPLISDVEDGLTACRSVVDRPLGEKFSARVTKDRKVPRTFGGRSGVNWLMTDYYWDEYHSATCQYYGKAYDKTEWSAYANQLGFFPSEFVPAAWELCPWSFLIDYFTSVGDVLNSWATAQRVGFSWVGGTTRLVSERSTECVAYSTAPWRYDLELESRGKSKILRKQVTRRKTSAVPLPTLQVSTKFSLQKGLNIAALAEGRSRDRSFKRR